MFFTSLALPLSLPSPPFSSMLRPASHRDTYMAVCACALARKNESRTIDERASEQIAPFSLFFFAYPMHVSCVCTHARTRIFFVFFSLAVALSFFFFFNNDDDEDDGCIKDIVFQACSYRRRRFLFLFIIHSRTRGAKEKEKKRECQVIGQV